MPACNIWKQVYTSIVLNKGKYFYIQMFGRTIKCSIAKDNGRASDFIRRKNYPDKSRCYECGVSISQIFIEKYM